MVQAGCSISPLSPVAFFDVMAHTSGVPEPFSWGRSGVLDWDAIGGVAGDSAGSGSEEDDGAVFRCTPEEAGVEFVNLLVALKRRGATVTATQVCQLCFWAAKAEIKGPAKQLALQPSAPTGHFSRKFDTYVGAPEDEEHYHIDVVSYNRADATRSTLS